MACLRSFLSNISVFQLSKNDVQFQWLRVLDWLAGRWRGMIVPSIGPAMRSSCCRHVGTAHFHSFLLLVALSWAMVFLPAPVVQAEIVVNGTTIEFRGNVRPGDIPTVVTIDESAFADEARAEPACTEDDFSNFLCRTQYQQPAPPIVPYSVQDALAGFSRQTSYQHPNGDLVLKFTDFLPVNNAGPDLAVFQGFTQQPFEIKVRTLDGNETPFKPVASQPFLQITGFDSTGQHWGPCGLERPFDPPTYPCNFAGLLLLFEIDLDLFELPAGTVVEEIVLRRAAASLPHHAPHIVMAAALQGEFTGPGPRPDPANVSGMIQNGFFDLGLDQWTTNGPGTVEVIQTLTGPATRISGDGEPTTLNQTISTPNTSFVISFDYRFATDNGSVDVLLGGTVIDSLPAQATNTFKHRDILVNNPDLMNQPAAKLTFQVNPGSFYDFVVGFIVSPSYNLLNSRVKIEGRAVVGGFSFEGFGPTQCLYPPDDPTNPSVCEEALGGGLFLSDETPFVDLPDTEATAKVSARAFALLEGVGTGVWSFAQSDPLAEFPKSTASPFSKGDATVRYRAVSPTAMGRYPINYKLTVSGQVDFSGNLDVDGNSANAEYSVIGAVKIFRARLGLSEEVPFAFAGKLVFTPQSAGPSIFRLDNFVGGSNCILEPNDPGPAPGTPAVSEPIEGPNFRSYEVNFQYCSDEILYAEVGDEIEVEIQVTLGTLADPPFDGFVNADFSRTVTASISTDVPGVEFIPVEFNGGGENQPPVAHAGPDQTVPTGITTCSAGVTLDGSGSTDPDGDPLTYSWTGTFGTTTGVSPMVTLAPGDHEITLTVEDGKGGSSTDTVLISVVDQTPPTITSLTVTPEVLWPPNHKLVPIVTQVNATDNCGNVTTALSMITTNEGDETNTFDPEFDTILGDGHTLDDIQIDGEGNISLRAERSGTGSGRVYTITYEATDEAGNTVSASTTVTVPHDQP